MRKHTVLSLSIIISCILINTGCNEDKNESSQITTMRTTAFDGVQGNCTSGGVKIEVLIDGVVDDTQTQYLCNGANGQNGQNGQGGQAGTNTTMRTTPFTDAQGGCTNGGIKFEVLVDGVTQTQYICNGTQGGQGQSGTNTTMRTTSFDGAQGSCTNGGVKIEVLVNGVVDDTQTQYICNGQKGEQGEQGEAGCPSGEKSCGGVCTDITTNIANCGACGHNCNTSKPTNAKTMGCVESQCTIIDCADGYIPQDGQCVSCSSVAGWAKCGGKCVETDSDNDNCGTCGNKCTNGLTCASGNCVGNTTCSDIAVNTDSSLDHCGKCNNRCDDGKTCIDGKCVTGYGQAYCGGDKVQIGNVDRCGGCNDKCADGKICKDNKCVDGAGPTYCNGSTTNTLNDVSNCGSCGHRCEDSICINGECVDGQGSYSTDEMYCNGKIIHYLSDSAHCNGCGNTCAVGFQCVAGTCQSNSLIGSSTLTCDGKSKINSNSDSANCGQCGNVCASHECIQGVCSPIHELISGLNVGDLLYFGHYEQDNNTSNGKEPIVWRILDKNSAGQYLIISEKVLDLKPYNTTFSSITWENSTIRSWLNGYAAFYNTDGTSFTSNNFINTAFTAAERAKIVSSSVPAHANPSHSTSPGNATTDKVFLLSITEANNYFSSNDDRRADTTRYAVKQGVYVYGSTSGKYTSDGTCTDVHCYADWFLRSPGEHTYYAALVNPDGSVYDRGDHVDYDRCGVRPALWVQY